MGIVIRRRRARPHLEFLEMRALLSGAGSLDPSFGAGTGSSVLSLGVPANDSSTTYDIGGTSVAIAPGGKIVEAGTILITSTDSAGTSTQTGRLSIGRFNSDGSVDTTFGIGGQAQLQLPLDFSNFSMAVQADGKIVVATSTVVSASTINSNEIDSYEALRFGIDGTLDTTFGTNGIASYPASVTTARLGTVASVVVEPGGKILLAGEEGRATYANTAFAVVQLNSDGSLDTNYGTGGTTTVPVEANGFLDIINVASGAALGPDGKLVLAGTASTGMLHAAIGMGPGYFATDLALVRLNTDGTLDTTFDRIGSVLLSPDPSDPLALGNNSAIAVAVQPLDGKIVATTTSSVGTTGPYQNVVYRLGTDGTLDTSFGTTGRVVPSVVGFNPNVLANVYTSSGSIAVEPDGQIVELDPGYATGTGVSLDGTIVLRLAADGLVDTTFGNKPTASGFQPGLKSIGGPTTLIVDPATGNVLLAGTGTLPSLLGRFEGYAVARVLSAPSTGPAATPLPATPPASFDGTGLTNLAVYTTATGSLSFPVTQGSTLSPVQFGSPGAGQSIPAAADYLGSGRTQFAVYLPAIGAYATLASNGQPSSIFQFGIPGAGQTIPVPADYEGTGQDDYAIYMPSIAAYAILPSSGAPGRIVQIGQPGLGNSIPAPADYFHTGQADLAVYLSNFGAFAVADPTGKTPGVIAPFGTAGQGDIPVPGDYDGSGHVELAIYVPSYGAFFYRPYGGGPDVAVPIGKAGVGEVPVPGDYDGSGHLEFAIYDPTVGVFAYKPANGGPIVSELFGPTLGGAVAVAAPASTLSEFSGATASGSSPGVKADAIVPGSGSSGRVSAASVTVSRSSTLPSGPTLGSARVARTLINQGSTDTFKLSN